MDCALDVSSSEVRQCVARIDGNRSVLRLNPFPFACLMILNLQRSDGLSEKQSPRAEVGVALHPVITDLLIFLGCVLGVFHVAEMILRITFSKRLCS